ncbi:Gfo/Idh/MocA family oxidoreductase [Cryobacterium sp. N19]|uniref:Gfo/Idh/MocA family oxidoreductase n=1 Tax=Cryobacterium sp. N19 TaxID=2048288 RepID=UPI000CE2D36B|nr:Gfo/Idh/MocA family oxidoreductase [Cryobacterium sp. N19]
MRLTGGIPLRYGIIGAGYFDLEFARILSESRTSQLVAAYSPGDANKLSRDLGCAVLPTLDDLPDRVDAVIVASPNHAHREPVEQAAQRGVHVF